MWISNDSINRDGETWEFEGLCENVIDELVRALSGEAYAHGDSIGEIGDIEFYEVIELVGVGDAVLVSTILKSKMSRRCDGFR